MFNKLTINNIGIASMRLNRFVKDLGHSIGMKLLHGANTTTMEAFVDIVNGDTVIHGKNSIVDQGLVGIINFLSGQVGPGTYGCNTNYSSTTSTSWNGSPPSYYTYMLVGSDTSYYTTHDMVALKSPIGTPTPTKPNSQSGSTSSPSTGVFQVQWTATWNPGTVSGTLGEAGLYLYIQPTLASFQATISNGTNLFSRIASVDGKFTAFAINTSVPLAITWTFQLTYAR